jgi:thiopurine S-methyltransferase
VAQVQEPWIERWQEGRTGWHEAEGSASLRQNWRATDRDVLVPLCGKSKDLKWLADQGNRVVGVELSELAVTAFFDEHALDYTVSDGRLPAYQATDIPITIYCGDYFELTQVQCNAHYDRGALAALPADGRTAYAAHTNSLLTADAEQLLITLEYDQEVANGPPFSVLTEEVLSYWPDLVCVDGCEDIANCPPKFIEAGLTSMLQKVWRSR